MHFGTTRRLLAGILLLFCSCHKGENPAGVVVATLSGQPISEGDLQESARFVGLPDLSLKPLDTWPSHELKIIFQETVVDRLLLEKAKSIGLTVRESQVTEERRQLSLSSSPTGSSLPFTPPDDLIRRRILLEKTARVVAPAQDIGTAALKAYYKGHMDRFTIPEKAVVRDIVVRSEDEGKAILDAIKAGNSFSALAKAKSLSPESRNGGLLPAFALGEMPSPFYRAFSMKPGDVSPLISSPYGYHILKLVQIVPSSVRPFSAVRDRIRDAMNRSSRTLALRSWVLAEIQKKILVIRPAYLPTLSMMGG